MPTGAGRRVLFYEGGRAPTTRSVRELNTLQAAGFVVTVAHSPAAADQVAALGFDSCRLPEPAESPFRARFAPWLAEFAERRESIGVQRDEARRRLTKRTQGGLVGRFVARAEGRLRRASGHDDRVLVSAMGQERADLAARIRAIHAIRRTPTPLTGGVHFGDLARLEPQWHVDARAMATVPADLMWAADLDALPAMIWAREAMATSATPAPPVIFDAHELLPDVDYLPELYRVAWRLLAERFVPLADAVLTVCEPLAAVLRDECGAKHTMVVANLAVPPAGPAGPLLRAELGLAPDVPLAVHIGRIDRNRNPATGVELAEHLPDAHVAFVGAGNADVIEELESLARQRGVNDRVHVVTPVPAERLTAFIADADLSLIMYSGARSRNLRLAMPNKLYDSLAAGVPVLATAGTAAAEFVVAAGLGRSFDCDTPGDVAAAARALLRDPASAQRARARRDEFTWTRAESTLIGLAEDLLPTTEERAP